MYLPANRILRGAIALGTVMFMAIAASSAQATPVLRVYIGDQDDTLAWQFPPGTHVGDDVYEYTGVKSQPDRYDAEFTIQGLADPFIDVDYLITNTSSTDRSFTLTSRLDIIPVGAPSLTGGWVAFTLIDNNGDGATLTSFNGNPIYTSLIDNTAFETLLDSPQTFNAPANDAANFGPFSFGDPIPSFVGPAANEDIGIRLSFLLSPGDTVHITGYFEIIPEPSSVVLALFGAAGLATIAYRRRRRE